MTLRRPDDIERRLNQLAEDYAAWFDVSKEQAMEWLRELLTGEAEPYRETGTRL